jgi:hypothetical protein
MLNDWNDKAEMQRTSTQDDISLELNRMDTFFRERKKRSNIATGLLMHTVFKKLLAIHEREKI